MSHDTEHDSGGGGGILGNKILWMVVGVSVFVGIGFLVPVPQSLLEIVRDNGFGDQMMEDYRRQNGGHEQLKCIVMVQLRLDIRIARF